MDEVTGVDIQTNHVLMGDRSVPYDYLVLATGVHDNYFGHPEWEHYAPGLKSIVDAISIRRKVLLAFEAAEIETDPAADELKSFDGGQRACRTPWTFAFRLRRPAPHR